MGKRDRVEDLGRISERLHAILDHDLFEWIENPEVLEKHCEGETQHIFIRSFLEEIKNELNEIWFIARFGDDEDGVDQR